jgi:hypothetical protein
MTRETLPSSASVRSWQPMSHTVHTEYLVSFDAPTTTAHLLLFLEMYLNPQRSGNFFAPCHRVRKTLYLFVQDLIYLGSGICARAFVALYL